MSAGYTPVFRAVFDGTLHGKWPQTGVWLALLAMADRHGCIDRTPEAIASDIGIPVVDLMACLREFCEPDPRSRTQEIEGRRLAPITEGRLWGWRVVNHAMYREKARLMQREVERVASGANRARMLNRAARAAAQDHPPTPADPRTSPQTHSPDSDRDKNQETTAAARPRGSVPRGPADPAELVDFKVAFPERNGNQPWRRALKAIRARLAEGHDWEELVDGAKRYDAWCRATGKIGTEQVMQAATFCGPDRPFLDPWHLPKSPAAIHEEAALRKLVERRDSIGLSGFRAPRPGESAKTYREAQDAEWQKRKMAPASIPVAGVLRRVPP